MKRAGRMEVARNVEFLKFRSYVNERTMKYIFSISEVCPIGQWYASEGSNDLLAFFDARTPKTLRSDDCWCGRAKAMWYEWMIEPISIYKYTVCQRCQKCVSRKREDRINWHLVFVGFYDLWVTVAVGFFSNMQMMKREWLLLLLAGCWSVRHKMNIWNEFSELLDLIRNRHQQNWPNSIIIMDFEFIFFRFFFPFRDTSAFTDVDANLFVYLQNEQFIWIKFQLSDDRTPNVWHNYTTALYKSAAALPPLNT